MKLGDIEVVINNALPDHFCAFDDGDGDLAVLSFLFDGEHVGDIIEQFGRVYMNQRTADRLEEELELA